VKSNVIVYVDLEHNRLRQDSALWQFFATQALETKYRLEAISGELCLIVHYARLTPALLRELNPQALVVGGHYTGLWHYAEGDLAGLRAVFREAAWPTLSFCGGFHLMAQTYGGETGPMEGVSESYPGTPHPPGVSGSDLSEQTTKQERGFMPVRVLEPHPLFEGLGRRPVVFQLHSWEVKSPPDGFRALAESDLCRVQALAYESRPLFGTQFHPEQYDDAHPDGRKILENFFEVAGIVV
jgi:GMP synthase-like glutamine amidotransferase